MKASLLLLASLLLCVAAQAQSAEEIVAKSIAARGGLARLKSIQSERIGGTISFGPGDSGPFFVELQRPGKMHMEISMHGHTIVRVFDGQSAGWLINPFADDKDLREMTPAERANIAEEADFDGPLVDYQAKGNSIALDGKEDVEGKPAYRIRLTNKSGDVRFYLFDVDTFLLVKWEGTRKAGAREFPVESYFRDYRDVSGVKFAFRIDSGTPGAPQNQHIIANTIQVDPQIPPSQFAKPPAPAPARPATPPSPPEPHSPSGQ